MSSVLIKRIKWGPVANYGDVPPYDGVMWLPICSCTSAELTTAWNNSNSVRDIVRAFESFGGTVAGYPSLWPGPYTGGSGIEQLENYNYSKQLVPYSTLREGTCGTSAIIKYGDASGNGIIFHGSTGLRARIDGNLLDPAGGNSGSFHMAGLYGYTNNTLCYAGGLLYAENSGIFYGFNVFLNRNNSSLYNFNYANSQKIITWLRSLPDLVPVDPYEDGGTSTTGGGGGTFDLESDIIGLPPLPTLSFAATGFTRIYNPTLSELNALANYLWTDTTFLDTVINHLKQLLENPMDAVISLSLLPCSIPNGSPETVKVMYINTGVTMAPATTQFVDVDCGTYTIEEFYGSALDYNPYTKVHCYLPYIGQVTIDTDEVMGKTLNVVYRIDIVTGMCAAMILVNQNVLYQFSGHCAINMPINSADFSGYIGAAMTAGKMVAGVVAGAAGAPALAAELIGAPAPHSSTSETTEKTTERNPKTGRQITTGTSTRTTTRNTPGASFGELSRKAAANTVGAVMGSKITVEHAGGFTGNSGYLAVRRPYLIIERPRMCNPEEYGKYNGRPSMIYMNLGECEGYTEVQSIQFENIPATNPELAELSELLKSGVLF